MTKHLAKNWDNPKTGYLIVGKILLFLCQVFPNQKFYWTWPPFSRKRFGSLGFFSDWQVLYAPYRQPVSYLCLRRENS